MSRQSDRFEIYVCAGSAGETVRVSTNGGAGPLWSPTGEKILLFTFNENRAKLWSAPLSTEPRLLLGAPRLLFTGNFLSGGDAGYSFEVSQDG